MEVTQSTGEFDILIFLIFVWYTKELFKDGNNGCREGDVGISRRKLCDIRSVRQKILFFFPKMCLYLILSYIDENIISGMYLFSDFFCLACL